MEMMIDEVALSGNAPRMGRNRDENGIETNGKEERDGISSASKSPGIREDNWFPLFNRLRRFPPVVVP